MSDSRLVFDGFEVDLDGARLTCGGEERPLERRSFELLRYLVARPGKLVTKDELLREVWGAQVLSEGVVSNTVAKLRKAIAQGNAERPIETVHGRGYRFHGVAREASTEHARPPPTDAGARARARDSLLPPSSAHDGSDPFVGRQAVMARLLAQLGQVSAGAENVLVLSGEAGIGKTRTARELAAHARARGMRVWTAAAHEGEGAPPYWPFVQLLRRAHDDLPEALWQRCVPAGSRRGSAIAELLPELGVPRSAAREPQTARFELFDAVAGFVRSAASDQPLLLIFDDLHWADAATIELLAVVARAVQEAPVTLLATLRTGETRAHDAPSPLAPLSRIATQVPLEGLGALDVAALAEALGRGDALSEARALVLHQKTHGNPLFVRQALDLMAQRGDFSLVDDAASTELPETVALLIRRRLSALPDATRGVLSAASVLGTDFELSLLAEVVGQPQADVLDALEPALRMGVVLQRSGARGGFRFAHAVTRDALCEELSLRERGALHACIAGVLHARMQRGAVRAASELAHHALHALPLDLERAVKAGLDAAIEAREASAFEAAIDGLSRVQHVLDAEGGTPEQRFAVQLELGENLFFASRMHAAWHAFRAAAHAAERIADARARAERLAEVAPRLVDCTELATGDPAIARSIADHALRELPEGDRVRRSSLLAHRAELSLEQPAQARAAWLDEADALAAESGSVSAVLDVAHSRAVLRDVRRMPECQRAAERFFALVAEHPEAAEGMRYRTLRRFDVHVSRYVTALYACDLPAADAALHDCEQLADSSHIAATRFVVSLMQAGRALGDDRLDALEPLALGLLGAGDGVEHAAQRVAGQSYFAALLDARGQLDTLAGMDLDTGFDLPNAPPRYAVFSLVSRARLYALTGRSERAEALLARLREAELSSMPAHFGDLGSLCALAEIAMLQGDRVAAERLHAQLAPYADANALLPTFDYRGAVAHFVGLLARMLGRSAEARACFEQAVAHNRRLRMPRALAASERELQST